MASSEVAVTGLIPRETDPSPFPLFPLPTRSLYRRFCFDLTTVEMLHSVHLSDDLINWIANGWMEKRFLLSADTENKETQQVGSGNVNG